MMLLSFTLVFTGFVLLSLAMKRHFKQLMPAYRTPLQSQITTLRILGFTCLISAAAMVVHSQGMGLGLVYWTGLLTFAALLQSLFLAYRPQWLMRLLLTGFISAKKTTANA